MMISKALKLAATAAVALCAASGASAASYLFTFQFGAVTSSLGNFNATTIAYSADSLDPDTLTYVSGDVNGVTSPVLSRSVYGPTQRAYTFASPDFTQAPGTVVDVFFSLVPPPIGLGSYDTTQAARGIRTTSGAFYVYTTGNLTITELAAAVPEPATWATLIAGFLLVGGAMRRRGANRTVRIAYS